MQKTGIKILDQTLDMIDWMKLPSYKRFRLRYGKRKAKILRDYIIFPLFGVESINKLRGKIGYRVEEIYEVLRLGYDWQKLVREVSRLILQKVVRQCNESNIRYKVIFSVDDTYDEKTGKEMEKIAVIKDHHDGRRKKVYNPVVLYCTIKSDKQEMSFPLDMMLWQQEKRKSKKRKKKKDNSLQALAASREDDRKLSEVL